jgi:hypothetical protein
LAPRGARRRNRRARRNVVVSAKTASC